MARQFWWNADFDLALQPGWRPKSETAQTAQVRDLGLHALLAASPEDSILLSEPPPEDFLADLRNNGIEPPRCSVLPEIDASAEFVPYGWSPQAVALSGRYDDPQPFPTQAVIRRVNSRLFGHQLERDLFESDAPRGSFSSPEELRALLESEPDASDGWVVKTLHGNAALGNRRIRSRRPTELDLAWIERHATGGMVLERWLPREMDLCAVFEVSQAGVISSPHVHETVHTAEGGFIGALFDSDPSRLGPWRDGMMSAAKAVGRVLAAEGYFGPVCIDGLVWRDRGGQRLRPLVEINARRHASEGWSRLARTWSGCVYGRFFSTRKLRLPRTHPEFTALSGDLAWDPESRIGTLVVSPLRLGSTDSERRPRKLAVLFRGRDHDHVTALEATFRERFEK